MKGQNLDPLLDSKVQPLDLERMRAAFVFAVDEACARLQWKKDAIAAALRVDPSYFTKLRSGEKPLSLRHIADLPDDIERIYARHYAEQFDLVCVDRPTTSENAAQHLVAGLLGLLQPRLPAKADRMARADLDVVKKSVNAR